MLANTARLISRQTGVFGTRGFDISKLAPSSTSLAEYTCFIGPDHRQYQSLKKRMFSDEKKGNSTTESTDSASEENAKEATEEELSSETATSEADEKVKQLEKQVSDLKKQVLRALADQENTRAIAKKDVESARQFAVTSFAKSLLDVSDNLTRAMEAVPEDMRADKDNNPVLASLYEGIQMTDQGLTKAFEKNGLKKYGNIGDIFNPNQHDALFEYPDPEKEAGTVGQVLKKGFMLHGRPIRAAEVGVIK